MKALRMYTVVLAVMALNTAQAQDISPQEAANDLVGVIMFSASPDHSPANWLPCDGKAYLNAQYPRLYAVIGNRYGTGDPADKTFRVPNMNGRVAIAAGSHDSSLNKRIGEHVGNVTSSATVTTGQASSVEHFYSTLNANLENPHRLAHTKQDHNHSATVDISTIQPGMILRCIIKAR